MPIDPVCNMTVEPENAAASTEYKGKTYYFCAELCRDRFVSNPDRFLDGKVQAQEGPAGALYICPMHPEIVKSEPGPCPICGMALEPRTVTLEEEANPELVYMTRRFWASLVLTLPVFVAAMSDLIPGQPVQRLFSFRLLNWTQLALATPVVLWGGLPFFQRGWASIVNRSLNMFTLSAIGVGVAYVYSVFAVLFPDLFPESFRGHGGEVGVYFDAAAVITTLVLMGQVLELRARSRTSSAIKALPGLVHQDR